VADTHIAIILKGEVYLRRAENPENRLCKLCIFIS